jgi:hypothetical protein
MRGAVSVALVYHFFDFSDESEHVASIIAMTIIVVVFSTMVFGAVTKPLLDLMLGKGQHLSDCCFQICQHLAELCIICTLHSASMHTLQLLAA